MVRNKVRLLSGIRQGDGIKKTAVKYMLGVGIILLLGGLTACQKKEKETIAPVPVPVQTQEGTKDSASDTKKDDTKNTQSNDSQEAIMVNKRGPIGQEDFLKAKDKNLRNKSGAGEVINLRGTNAGGWLFQEFWMTPTNPGTEVKDESTIYSYLESSLGKMSCMSW